MSEETTTPADQPQQQQQQIQVMVDERDMRTIYANSYRINPTNDEVVIDLVFSMPNPNVQPGQAPQQMLFKVTDRVVLSYVNAKRLSLSLQQLVKRFEQQFGEIPVGRR
jgi:hypothetical protein